MLQGDFKKGHGIVSVYLIDFNTARVFDAERNRDTELIGTRGFAAPEQYGFSQSDARTDIYGLGVLLNYMLCGKLIRDGIYADHQEVSQIIRKATQIDPEKRYQTAEEMLDAMQQSMILDEATDKVSLNDKSRPAWTRFLPPGFREGKILNMVVAAIYYIFWMYFCLTVEVKDHGEPLSGTWLYVNRFVYFMMFIITPFFGIIIWTSGIISRLCAHRRRYGSWLDCFYIRWHGFFSDVCIRYSRGYIPIVCCQHTSSF